MFSNRFAIALVALVVSASCVWGQVAQTGAGRATPSGGGGGGGYTGPGDVVASATVWYSCSRGYSNNYAISGTNPACNIRRSSDSHTCDILIATSGSAGNTANCSTGGDNGQSAASFCNATSCFIVKAYDQSGASACSGHCDMSQGTTSSQLQLTFSCIGSSTCMARTSSTSGLTTVNLSLSTPVTTIMVAESFFTGSVHSVTLGISPFLFGFDDNSGSVANVAFGYLSGTVAVGAANDNQFHAVSVALNPPSSSIQVDGTNTAGSATTTTSTTNPLLIGDAFFGLNTTDQIVEVGMWPSGLSLSAQTNLCKNEQAYYGAAHFGATC